MGSSGVCRSPRSSATLEDTHRMINFLPSLCAAIREEIREIEDEKYSRDNNVIKVGQSFLQ